MKELKKCQFCGAEFSRSDFEKFLKHQRLKHDVDTHFAKHNWKLNFRMATRVEKKKHTITFNAQDLVDLVAEGQTLIITRTDEYLIVASVSLKNSALAIEGKSGNVGKKSTKEDHG